MSEQHETFRGRVLLVDDMAVNQMVAAGLMRQMGIDVDIAEGGADALRMIGDNVYDLVFMDIYMPGMDGLEITRRIRASELVDGTGRLPVFALTAVSQEEDKQACTEAGMDGHMAKPLMREQLIEVLERYLESGAGAAAGAPVSGDGCFVAVVDKGRFDDLCETMHGISNGVSDVLVDYLDSVGRLTEDISDGLESGDLDKLVLAAHSLKSNSITVGALALAGLSLQIETAGREGRTDGCDDLLELIEREFNRIRPGLKEIEASWRADT